MASFIDLLKLQYSGTPESEQSIRDRERELEKIHRRSRELMLSPRTIETTSNSLLTRDIERALNNGTCKICSTSNNMNISTLN